MPLDVLGCTRATMDGVACFSALTRVGNHIKPILARDWGLQIFPMNEEFPVSMVHSNRADYVPALCTHRPSLLPIE